MRYLAIILMLFARPVAAETVKWQDYEIHYTTFTSTLIPAEVARIHGITRSRSRIVTNIVVRKNGQPVAADVRGSATNLLNQMFTLSFLEVTEDKAIYYLATQVIDERDTLGFDIAITPSDSDETYEFRFKRQYYAGAR